jgi:hypothetical protein
MCIIASPPRPIWSDVVIGVGLEMQLRCQIILQIWGEAKLIELFFSFYFFLSGMGWDGVVRVGH